MSPLNLLNRSSEPQLTKFKYLRLLNGIEYIGRLNNGLSNSEILSDLQNLENTKFINSKEIVKWPLKSVQPSARDFYLKLIYDKIRNRKKFIQYTNPEEIEETTKRLSIRPASKSRFY